MAKITVIGTGSVGSTIGYTLAVTSLASEIVLIDINADKSLGEALDIRQGMPFCGNVKICAGTYSDAKDSDIVIITSGVARKPGQSRLDLAQTNVNIIRSITPEITKYAPNAIYIIVSNPVDILTYAFTKYSGIPENRIIGSGTILDTARLRVSLAEYYSINHQNVHAYVFGEHGDSSFVPWSLATISDVPVDEYRTAVSGRKEEVPVLDKGEMEMYMRRSGAKIIECKGATFYAVSLGVTHICRSVMQGADTSLTVSTMLHGEYGISDVCLSMLSIVGRNGIDGKIVSPLTPYEVELMRNCADALKNAMNSIKI